VSDTSHDRAGEYQCVATVDAEGYVVSMSATRTKTVDFYKALKTLPRLPLEDSAIVLPPQYTRDPQTGRGIHVSELGQHDGYYVMDLTTVVPEPRVAA
jgi:hypothetical protein